jgi:hypothetical protein
MRLALSANGRWRERYDAHSLRSEMTGTALRPRNEPPDLRHPGELADRTGGLSGPVDT